MVTTASIASPRRRSGQIRRIEIVVIGVSTGGPAALITMARDLPSDLTAPVLIAQHMLATFIARFAEKLQQQSHLHACEAREGAELRNGCIYLAPGGRHLTVAREGAKLVARLERGPAENGCLPAVDPLFRSAARVCGMGTLAVVMTGLGVDGLAGCREVSAMGGDIYVQDQASSAAGGMPGAIEKAGLATRVLPLNQLGNAIALRVATR